MTERNEKGHQAPVVILTGAGGGIGSATAEHLARRGYRVVLCGRTQGPLEAVSSRISACGGQSMVFACDVADKSQTASLVEQTLQSWGRIDVLVNNAGTMDPIGYIIDLEPEDVYHHLSTNLVGPFNMCRAVLPFLIREGRGVVINVSSGAADHALPGWGAYCCSKAALTMFTQVLHREVGDLGIRVYGFRPGMVNTQMTRNALKNHINRVSELDPGNFADPAEPARGIAWLCSEAAADAAGQELDIRDSAFRERIDAPLAN